MAMELSEQRTSLEREVGRLDDLLEADANWRALRALLSTGADGVATPSTVLQQADHEQERQRLERALKSNRVYCARERLLEVIELMDAEAEGTREATVSAPDLFDEPSPDDDVLAAPAVPPHSLQENTIPAPAAFSGKASGSLSGKEPSKDQAHKSVGQGDAFRTRVKVKIRTAPPDTDLNDLKAKPQSPPDDLTAIRSLDRSIAAKLNALGVTRWEQIAGWRTSDVRSVSAALGLNREISRGNWIEQAALLAARAGRPVAAAAPNVPLARSSSATEASDGSSKRVDPPTKTANDDPHPQVALSETATPADALNTSPANAAESALPAGIVGGMIATAAASIAGRLGGTRAAGGNETTEAAAPDAVEPSEQVEQTAVSTAAVTATEIASRTSPEPQSDTPPAVTTVPDDVPAAPDALTLISSITPAREAELNELGVTNFGQIAGWTVEDVAHISVVMGLGSRITRENWIEQAAVLARGELTAYARSRAERGALSLAPPPSEPLRADPQMQARLADISERLATPVAEKNVATPVAELDMATPVAESQTEPTADHTSETVAEPDATSTGEGQVSADPTPRHPGQVSETRKVPESNPPAGGTAQKELTASVATVVLSASAAHALTAFASRQKLGSQLRQDVVIEPETHPRPSSQMIAPEASGETTNPPGTVDSAIDEDDVATEIVLPVATGSEASSPQGDTAVADSADDFSDDISGSSEPTAEAAQIAVIEIPADDSFSSIDALEADVKLVPRGSPVPFDEAAPEIENVPGEAPATRSFAPRSTAPSAEEFDDDDLPAWNGQIEEASVEIVPVAVRSTTPPREYDEPAPTQEPASAQPDVSIPGIGGADRSGGSEEAEEKPLVSRFLKALDGGSR